MIKKVWVILQLPCSSVYGYGMMCMYMYILCLKMSHKALYFSKIVVKKLHIILTQMNVHFITMTQLLLW